MSMAQHGDCVEGLTSYAEEHGDLGILECFKVKFRSLLEKC